VASKKEEGVDAEDIFCLTLSGLEHCYWLVLFVSHATAFGNLNVRTVASGAITINNK